MLNITKENVFEVLMSYIELRTYLNTRDVMRLEDAFFKNSKDLISRCLDAVVFVESPEGYAIRKELYNRLNEIIIDEQRLCTFVGYDRVFPGDSEGRSQAEDAATTLSLYRRFDITFESILERSWYENLTPATTFNTISSDRPIDDLFRKTAMLVTILSPPFQKNRFNRLHLISET